MGKCSGAGFVNEEKVCSIDFNIVMPHILEEYKVKMKQNILLLLKNKNTVITGCNRGIGKEIVRVFAENGANIWACVREESGTFSRYINNLEKKHSVSINPVYFDLTEEEQIKTGVKTIKKTKEPVDILVNNAGLIFTALFQMTSIEKIKEIFGLN